MLIKSLAELKLFLKSLELIREVSQPCYTILGVLVSIHSDGLMKAPTKKFLIMP